MHAKKKQTLSKSKSKEVHKETLNNETVLVCGGAGFIGSNFIHQILEKYPKVSVINFDLLTYSGNLSNLKDVKSDTRYRFIKGNIADESALASLFKKYKPSYVINFAAETHVDRSIHVGALEFIQTNVTGVFNLLENVRRGEVKKYLQVSTDEVYGSLTLGSKKKFREDTPFAPNVPYAATKAGGDMLCRAYHNTWGVPVVVTHCSNNYGPFQYPEKLIPFFVLRMLEGKKLPLYGDGLHVRDWIHVLDHCSALELCLLGGKPGGVYNIGADDEMNNREIAGHILACFHKDDSWLEFVGDRPGHDRRYAIDSTLIRTELGWKPKKDFKRSFKETVEWYKSNTKWVDDVRKKTGVFNPHIDLWQKHNLKK
jgi:dTDP-glucose 4,6-dehydratase